MGDAAVKMFCETLILLAIIGAALLVLLKDG